MRSAKWVTIICRRATRVFMPLLRIRAVGTIELEVDSAELEARKSLGLKVMIFLLVLTGLLYALKRQIWKDVH